MQKKPADIRKDYSLNYLTESTIEADPFLQFGKWWNEALEADISEVNAMTLATASAEGLPSARIVLLKEFNSDGFVFFTNYNSYKGKQLAENPRACLVFYWKEMERQVRISGAVTKLSSESNDLYFRSRPEQSQVGAIVSPQSQVINNREWLDDQFSKAGRERAGKIIQRPDHWGGYEVKPFSIEFWQGRPNRLHDRIQYTQEPGGNWKIERLAP